MCTRSPARQPCLQIGSKKSWVRTAEIQFLGLVEQPDTCTTRWCVPHFNRSRAQPDLQAVHTALASLLIDQPDRRAWHRAAAVGGPDAEVASELADAAVRAQSRGAPLVAVSALERAT